eukprot:9491757-Pyramimonas_sp.AAC.1
MGLSSGVKLRKPVMISGRSSTSSGLKSSKYFFVTATRSSLKRSESDSLMRRSRKTRSTSCTHRRTALSGSEYADRIMRHMPCATLVDGGVYHLWPELGHVRVKGAQVPLHHARVDAAHDLCGGHHERKGGEVALHARRDGEGARGGVHACHQLALGDLLEQDLHLVEPTEVVHVLARELDGALRVVLVHVRHVHVVEKDDLQRGGVGERVQVDGRVAEALLVHGSELGAHQRCLARARGAHEHDVVLVLQQRVQEVVHAGGVDGGHEQVAEVVDVVRVRERLHAVRPGHHHGGRLVHVVVKHEALLGVGDVLPLRHPPLGELGLVVVHLVHQHGAADRPRAGKHELELHELLVGARGPTHRLLGHDAVQDLAHGLRLVYQHKRHERAEVAAAVLQALVHVAAEQLDEQRHILLVLERVDPRVHHWRPPDVLRVDEDDAATGHGGGRAVYHVVDLQQQAHGARERDALVGGEREHLVVVHHGVHRLDPLRVDVAIQDDPLVHVHLICDSQFGICSVGELQVNHRALFWLIGRYNNLPMGSCETCVLLRGLS